MFFCDLLLISQCCLQDQASNVDVLLADADGTLQSIKVFFNLCWAAICFALGKIHCSLSNDAGILGYRTKTHTKFSFFFWNRNSNLNIETWFDVMRYWQALSQSDGRWRYSPDKPESCTYAAGNYIYWYLSICVLVKVVKLALVMRSHW